MTLDDLRAYLVVCQSGNLTAAAQELSCSQSAVSQHVRRLERELGVPLLERRTRGVAVTPAGRVLWQAASEALDALGSARHRLEELRLGDSGRVRITTGGTTVRHFMADAVATFRQRYPRVELDFQSASSTQRCIEALLADQADLAFVTTGSSLPGVEQRQVISLPWMLVVRGDDPLAAREQVDLEDLRDIRYISLPASSTSQLQLEHNLTGEGIFPPSKTSVDNWDTAVLMVELGLGQAIVPAIRSLALSKGRQLRSVPIPALAPVTFGWAARRWDGLSAIALEFAGIVADHLSEQAEQEQQVARWAPAAAAPRTDPEIRAGAAR